MLQVCIDLIAQCEELGNVGAEMIQNLRKIRFVALQKWRVSTIFGPVISLAYTRLMLF